MTTFKDTPARAGVIKAAHILRPRVVRSGRVYADAWSVIETYLAVSMRLLDETPFTEIKAAAVTEEIKARLDGRV
jgi:hypothetical protein